MQDNYKAQAEFLVQSAPSFTVKDSPLFGDYISALKIYDTNVSLDTVVPHMMWRMQSISAQALAKLPTETPVDQTITCAFGRIYGTQSATIDAESAHRDMMDQFKFMIRQVHCLDHLEFIRRVINNINEAVLGYSLMAWNRSEEAKLSDTSLKSEEWYSQVYLEGRKEENALHDMLDALDR